MVMKQIQLHLNLAVLPFVHFHNYLIENDVDVYSLKGWHLVLDLEDGIEPKTPEARPAAILAPVAEVVVHPEPPVGNCHGGDRDGGIPGRIPC